jgi:hypothetical protein
MVANVAAWVSLHLDSNSYLFLFQHYFLRREYRSGVSSAIALTGH